MKCDIKKFFDSIDHKILLGLIKCRVKDQDLHWLIEEIVDSFGFETARNTTQLELFERERESFSTPVVKGRGIPIGNLTSQLFANIYLNEFDQFVKHELKVKYYCRYTDDFVIVSSNAKYLQKLLPPIQEFLENNLKLKLHPNKV